MDDEPVVAAQRILTLVGALGVHDRRTRGHSERVRAFNDLIAQELRLPQHDRDRLRWAALLHDIGKLHVPTKILNKPKKPTEKEWAVLKSHPARGARITAPLSSWLGPWADTIEQHHERWDGAGYPNNLSGADISLGARIVAVADAYEVMTAPRPYSRPVSAAAAREELARCAGAQFDPEVVRAFLNISIGKLRKVIGPISWLAQLPLIDATPKLEVTVGNAGRQVVSAAAAATGTGVVAAAMLPQAAHAPQHHEQLVLSAGAATVQTQTHAAAPTSPSRPVVPHAPASSHPTAAKAPAVTSHVVRASATNVATVHKSSSPTATHTDSSSPTRPQGMPAKPVTAPRPSQPTTKTSKPTPPTAHDPAPAPAPPDDPKPAPPPKDPKQDPAPTPTSSTDSGSGGHDDPQPDHGNDDDAGHGHGN
jgi:putative nucleotidyltransferase with HDIG domain